MRKTIRKILYEDDNFAIIETDLGQRGRFRIVLIEGKILKKAEEDKSKLNL